MCGITGCIGDKVVGFLIQNLKDLQYRGYDSAGIAIQSNGRVRVIKSLGAVSLLEKKCLNLSSTCGIGHTRWATNGEVNLKNCHPHISFDGKWVLVHNGIIENAQELKEKYLNNIDFKSETDSELVAHLIAIQKGLPIEKIAKAMSLLRGSWAFAIINKEEKNKIYIAKNKSPIFFSKGKEFTMVASDPICFNEKSDYYYSLKDKEIASVEKSKIEVYDAFLNKKNSKKIEVPGASNAVNNKFKHFMLKEINDTKGSLLTLSDFYKDEKVFQCIDEKFIDDIEKIKIVGCGTAYNTGLVGASYLKRELKLEVEVCVASEFRYSTPLIDKKTLCIFISQSGETADTIECLKLAKKKKCKIIGITNVACSQISKLCKIILPICAGKETAVASTKAYTCGLAVFYLLSKHLKALKKQNENIYKAAIKDIIKLSKRIEKIDFQKIKKIAKKLNKDVFFIGRGIDYFSAIEASLKLKEVSYINANAYPAGELKHGFIALIEKDTPVFVFATQKKLINKTLNGVHEIISRGGKVLLISTKKLIRDRLIGSECFLINWGKINQQLLPLFSGVFSQYLAYYTSVSKGLNPDMPRNLAKSVTVE